MRKQYHFARGPDGLDAWDVDRLIERVAGLEVHDVALESLADLDTDFWFDGSLERPTVRRIVEHVRLIEQVDVAYPIILGADGRVMDGMHRVARALLEGRATIPAVRFAVDPPPDVRNCRPEALSYDEEPLG
jgi:hypothetical protein